MHRNGVYPFLKKYGPTNYSGVNFFNGEYGRFPDFQFVQRMYVVLEKGDCFFLPSYWWSSTRFDDGNSLTVNFTYKSHSRWVELLMKGIELEEF